MKDDQLKILLYSFIKGKQSFEDECDSPGNLAVEFDNPLSRHNYEGELGASGNRTGGMMEQEGMIEQGWMMEPPVSPLLHFPFGTMPILSQEFLEKGRQLAEMATEFSAACPDKSIIRFEKICMVEEPKEQIIYIPIIRLSNFSCNVATVSWKTCDKTAFSNVHYVGSSGEIVFSKGDTKKNIEIQILNSTDEANDLRFTIELTHIDGLFNPTPMTISLKKTSCFYANELQVLKDLPRSLPFSIDDVKYALGHCINNRTFHMALTHLCSKGHSIDAQLALACDLSWLCFRDISGDSILNVLKDFFRMDD